MTHRGSLALAVAVGLGLAVAAPADASSPAVFLGSFFERINATLRSADPRSGPEEPRQTIRLLVNEVFDFRGAAALALGSVWRSRTPAEQEEFTRLFAGLLERGYVATMGARASLSGGLTVRYEPEAVLGDEATVPTTILTRRGDELSVDYHMIRRGERWAIRDVVIDGVSLVANYRAQFTRILGTSSYAELVARLRASSPGVSGSAVVAAASGPIAAPAIEAETPGRSRPPAATPPPVPLGPAVPVPAPPAPSLSPAARPEHVPVARPVEVPSGPLSSPVPITDAAALTVMAEAAPRSRVARTTYWVQVGAFKTLEAARRLVGRLRHEAARVLGSAGPSPAEPPATALSRVRVGPFANRAEAISKMRGLKASGYEGFIAEARD